MGFSVPVVFRSYRKKVSAPAGPVTLIEDTFTDTDNVLIQNHTIAPTNTPATSWSAAEKIALTDTGTIKVSSNQVHIMDAASSRMASVVDVGLTDVVVTADVTTNGWGGNTFEGLTGRWSSSSSYWFFALNVNTDAISIREVTTERAAASKVIAINTAYACTVTLAGNALTFNVDGTSCTYTSTTNNDKTKHGIVPVINGGGYTLIDNFKVVG
jgi:hypothetical protein